MDDALGRYHRQMLLPGFGAAGQQRLLDSTALILGCGALGSIAADMLARAGVGHLVIVDRDYIELTNLQRQVLFDEHDVADALPKAEAAKRRIGRINTGVRVTAIVDDVNHANIERYAAGVDVIVDGLDNFETRYLANDLSVSQGIPYVYGAAVGTAGMMMTVLPHTGAGSPWEPSGGVNLATPCLRCLFDEPPPPGATATCDTAGVINAVVGIVAHFQVAEALKILTGNFDHVNRTLLKLDLWTNAFHQLNVENARDAVDCPCCKHRRFDYLDGKLGSHTAVLCGRNAVQLRRRQDAGGIDLQALAARLSAHGPVSANEYMLRADVTEGGARYEITLFPNGRAIVKGTDEPAVARGVYAKYVGT
jgi:adenylyltransferase/sulfurtransferase